MFLYPWQEYIELRSAGEPLDAVFKGTQIMVKFVLEQLTEGSTVQELLEL
jgi:uncharacterized protein (DUF433 family)